VIILRFDYFFVGIYKEPQELPYKTYIVVFWNWEFNLYKKQKLAVGKMKHEMEESSGDIVSKRCKIKELEKLLTLKQLGKINFFSFTHNNIWILMREEIGWAKKVGVVRIRKLTWTLVNELVVKEMISSYNHAY
jgi:hypothetical protein